MSEKLKLALIYGGKGLEREVSAVGARNLLPYLNDFETLPIFINEKGLWLIAKNSSESGERMPDQAADTERVSPLSLDGGGGFTDGNGVIVPIDVAFPLLHGDFGEDGSVQGALESAGIPHFGCKAAESGLCHDKIYTKIIAESLGIPTAQWFPAIGLSAKEAEERIEESLGFPVFVKPARLGSSFGASPVKRREDFKAIYEKAKELGGGRVLVERLVDVISELECVYLKTKSKELFTRIGEIRCSSDFYDYDTKYKSRDGAEVIALSPLEEKHGKTVRTYSERLKRLIGIRDLSRFDFFLDSSGRILFNEINTVPGFTPSSLCPALIEASGEDLGRSLYSAISKRAEEG